MRHLVLAAALGVAALGCGLDRSGQGRSPEIVAAAAVPTAVAALVPAAPETVARVAITAPLPAEPTPQVPLRTARPELVQLLADGCCVQAAFSPDGRQVRFIDRPTPAAPVGIYAVDLANVAQGAVLVSPTVGWRSRDLTIVGVPEGRGVRFWNEVSGESWFVNTNGGIPSIAPGNGRLVWSISETAGSFDQRRTEFWTAALDGSGARVFYAGAAASLAGWFPDGHRVLISARETPAPLQERTLFVLDLDSGQRTTLMTQKGLRSVELAPDGSKVAFFVAFALKPEENGLSVINSDGSGRRPIPAPGLGSWRWRDPGALLFIPMMGPGDASMRLFAIDVVAGAVTPLTEPATTPFLVANADWDVRPDGGAIVFVSAHDHNLWLLTLP